MFPSTIDGALPGQKSCCDKCFSAHNENPEKKTNIIPSTDKYWINHCDYDLVCGGKGRGLACEEVPLDDCEHITVVYWDLVVTKRISDVETNHFYIIDYRKNPKDCIYESPYKNPGFSMGWKPLIQETATGDITVSQRMSWTFSPNVRVPKIPDPKIPTRNDGTLIEYKEKEDVYVYGCERCVKKFNYRAYRRNMLEIKPNYTPEDGCELNKMCGHRCEGHINLYKLLPESRMFNVVILYPSIAVSGYHNDATRWEEDVLYIDQTKGTPYQTKDPRAEGWEVEIINPDPSDKELNLFSEFKIKSPRQIAAEKKKAEEKKRTLQEEEEVITDTDEAPDQNAPDPKRRKTNLVRCNAAPPVAEPSHAYCHDDAKRKGISFDGISLQYKKSYDPVRDKYSYDPVTDTYSYTPEDPQAMKEYLEFKELCCDYKKKSLTPVSHSMETRGKALKRKQDSENSMVDWLKDKKRCETCGVFLYTYEKDCYNCDLRNYSK